MLVLFHQMPLCLVDLAAGESVLSTRTTSSPHRRTQASTDDYLTSYFTFHNQRLLLVVIYRPGLVAVTTTFFLEFADFLAVLTKFSCELLILGDINIHLDELNNVNTKKFNRLFSSHAFEHRVTEPTHTCNHTLDIVIIRSHILRVRSPLWLTLSFPTTP